MKQTGFLLIFFLLWSCKTNKQVQAAKPQHVIRGEAMSSAEIKSLYDTYVSAIAPGGKINSVRGISRKGILFDGENKIPVITEIFSRPAYFIISINWNGHRQKIVEFSGDSLLYPENLKTQQRDSVIQSLKRLTENPLTGFFGFFVRNNYPFYALQDTTAGDIPVRAVYTLDQHQKWTFYFDKKTGILVKIKKSNQNGTLFAIDLMDFRNNEGFLLSYHMIVYDSLQRKKTYIWKKITLKH